MRRGYSPKLCFWANYIKKTEWMTVCTEPGATNIKKLALARKMYYFELKWYRDDSAAKSRASVNTPLKPPGSWVWCAGRDSLLQCFWNSGAFLGKKNKPFISKVLH